MKQNCNPCQEISNGMRHTTYMHINQGDFWHLMVGSQIDNLTFDLFLSHNLCFKYRNGMCEPILDIYVPKKFQRYKELFNLMSFDPYNCLLKIWKSIETLTPKMGAHLGVWGVHSLTLSYTHGSMKCDSWASFLACTFASLYLGHEPKARVATIGIQSGVTY